MSPWDHIVECRHHKRSSPGLIKSLRQQLCRNIPNTDDSMLSPTSMSPESVNLVLITSCSSNSIFTCAFPCRIERTCRRIPQTTMRRPNSSNDFTSWVSLNQVYIVFFNREKLKDESLFLVIIIPILKSRKRFRIWKIRIQTRISRLTRVVFASTSCISLNVIVYAS